MSLLVLPINLPEPLSTTSIVDATALLFMTLIGTVKVTLPLAIGESLNVVLCSPADEVNELFTDFWLVLVSGTALRENRMSVSFGIILLGLNQTPTGVITPVASPVNGEFSLPDADLAVPLSSHVNVI